MTELQFQTANYDTGSILELTSDRGIFYVEIQRAGGYAVISLEKDELLRLASEINKHFGQKD